MKNNEIMNETTEVIEEIAKTRTEISVGKVALPIGMAAIAGGLLCKFAVEPAAARFKEWRKRRQMITVDQSNQGDCEGDVVVEDLED